MKTLYLDCFSGISGDMFVGALIDAGADVDRLREALASLKVPGFHIEAAKVNKKGIMATQFRVILDTTEEHPHRHLSQIAQIIEAGDLPAAVKSAAIETFRLLGEAEASIHGMDIEHVHYHEVGAVDSIVDIVATQYALYLLGIEEVVSAPLRVGHGTVQAAHGVMPVPAPATAKLLAGKPTYGGDVEGELVTPTGAALVAQRVARFGAAPPMTVERIGYGSGTRNLPDRANVLRVFVGISPDVLRYSETITVIEAHVDDMIGELIPPVIEALLAAGARDAFVTPVLGKKGRPAHLITALCDAERVQASAQAIFGHTTTLGLRIREERRLMLERHMRQAQTPWGTVKVKVGLLEGAQNCAAPEFEDCRRLADTSRVPVRSVYEAALAAALRGEFEDE